MKTKKIIFIVLLLLIILPISVYAEEIGGIEWDICKNVQTLKVFKFIGRILQVAFILIPIILIVMGSIDFMKAVVAGKDDDIKKSQTTFIKRTLAAVIVFLVPLITSIVMNVLDVKEESNCLTCILDPSKCNVG